MDDSEALKAQIYKAMHDGYFDKDQATRLLALVYVSDLEKKERDRK